MDTGYLLLNIRQAVFLRVAKGLGGGQRESCVSCSTLHYGSSLQGRWSQISVETSYIKHFPLAQTLGFVSCLQSNRRPRKSKHIFAGFGTRSHTGCPLTSLGSHFHFQSNVSFSTILQPYLQNLSNIFIFSLWWKNRVYSLKYHQLMTLTIIIY